MPKAGLVVLLMFVNRNIKSLQEILRNVVYKFQYRLNKSKNDLVECKVYRGGMGIWGGTGCFANIFQKRLVDNVKCPFFWLIYHLKDIYS